MNRSLCLLTTLVLTIGVTYAFGQRPKRKNEFVDLKESLDGLEWEHVDFEAMSDLERCRTMTLFDHALTEIGAVATAEADLMSAYLDFKGLGPDYASSEAADTAPARTFDQAKKTAAALLQGPMAESRYATMYEGSGESDLRAAMRLHESASKRKWGQFSEPVRFLRGMTSYLRAGDKYKDYMAWSGVESARRQEEHDMALAEKRADAKAQAHLTESERIARAEELAELRWQNEETRLAQQALYSQSTADPNVVVVNNNDGYSSWYPRRYHRRPSNPIARPYHRNSANQVRARGHTQQRMNNWHGAGGANKAGGARRGGGRRR